MQDYYNINVEGSHFDHGSCVVYNDYGQAASDQVLLAEINSTIERIEKTEPLIAKALNELQHAIEEQNKPKISTLIHNGKSERLSRNASQIDGTCRTDRCTGELPLR